MNMASNRKETRTHANAAWQLKLETAPKNDSVSPASHPYILWIRHLSGLSMQASLTRGPPQLPSLTLNLLLHTVISDKVSWKAATEGGSNLAWLAVADEEAGISLKPSHRITRRV